MSGSRRTRAWLAGLLCLLALAFGTSCGGPAGQDSATEAVERLLDRRAAAVLERDEAAYLATGVPGTARRDDEFRNIAQVPLGSWEYRLNRLDRSGATATAAVQLRYRLDGHDRAPQVTSRTLDLAERDGRWYVTAERPDRGATQQLWEQGPVTAVHGERSLVLGAGPSRERLRGYADLADRAVPQVHDAWGRDWPGRVVVLVPGSLDAMAGLLGADAAGYRGIAAVTTGDVDGSKKAPADRVIINPEAYDVLGDLGQQLVLTHETTHVATRAHTSAATPLWLSEGFADWVAYRGSGRGPQRIAPELTRAVQRGDLPAALPTDEDFAFTGDAGRLAQAYEGGWLASRMIAGRWGEEKLLAFYQAVGEHKRRAGAVEAALRDVLDTTPGEFTADWRAYLRDQLG
ncbi:hypothetical protein [Streptomyces apocyni]|uniref:hypothetical protein n=1 Tax=Streptomyces apocyni TaxID=2654677 RepID=UPI0012EAD854|nr:hypothetical protein [Streptomyces apocyni]